MKTIKSLISALRGKGKQTQHNNLTLELEHAGHKFYTFKEFDYTLYNRYIAFVAVLGELDLGVSVNDIKAIDSIMGELVEEKAPIGRALVYTQHLVAYSDMYVTEKNLFRLAELMIILDDEPVNEINEEYQLKKADLFEKSPKIKSFFFSKGIALLTTMGLISEDLNAEEYLNQATTKKTEQIFSKLIKATSYKAYLTDSTYKPKSQVESQEGQSKS